MSNITLSKSGSLMAAANSHAVRARINKPIAVIDNNWQALVKELPTRREESAVEQLWVDNLSINSYSDKAESIAIKEMNRSIYFSEIGLRATLFVYRDGVADLIVVADKTVYDKASLLLIIRKIIGSENSSAVVAALSLSAEHFKLHQALSPSEVDDIAVKAVALEGEPDVRNLTVIIGHVLAAYEVSKDAPVAWMKNDNDNAGTLDCQTQYLALSIALDADSTIASLVERLNVDKEADMSQCKVGIIHDQQTYHMPGVSKWQYLPCLGPSHELTFIISEGLNQATSLLVMFNRKTYCPDLIKRMLNSVRGIAAEISKGTNQKLDNQRLLAESEQASVSLLGRNDIEVEPPCRVEERISELAQSQPDNIAVCFEDYQLTYRELEEKANQVAHTLLEKGVAKGEHIGICLSRSAETVITMLAILKTGCVYVPLDPNYPLDRISYTCTDGDLKFIISELAEIPEIATDRVLFHGAFFAESSKKPTHKPEIAGLSVSDAAYIIYTSGSTGKPKGVVIPHCNLTHLINATKNEFGLHNQDVWSLFHSTAFDFSVWEIWGCLLTGGKLVVVSYWTSRNVEEFATLVREKKITVLSQTPSAFIGLIREDEFNPVGNSIRLVIFGGEALDTRALIPWFDRHPETQCRLVNMYGITETTVHVTAQNISRHHAVTASRSVGKPLPGWYIYILDEKQRMLPPGVSGEIYVGGAGVAMFYHGRPDLTSERFIPDPFHKGTMYRSGDKGMMLENGEMLHMGRLDDQIKLRGFRIELGEIRNTMLAAEGITAAAVTFTQKDPHDPATARLDTYVMLKGISIDDVITHAKRYLPIHMQSSSYREVSDMPLTPNGKLDTKRIEEFVIERDNKNAQSNQKIAEPTSEESPVEACSGKQNLEDLLVAIWTATLGKPVKAEDNFFDLGGNSLYAIRISAAAKEAGLPQIHMRELYIYQTITNLAGLLREQYSIC